MVSIETTQDIETFRQVAILLSRQNQKLIDRIKALSLELSKLRGQELTSAQLELGLLKELLANRNRALFGESSEKRLAAKTPPANPDPKPRTGHGPREQRNLPIVEQMHDVPEAERVCKACGGTDLSEMKGMEEESEEVTVVERQFVLVRHRRKKYRCSCNGCIVTAAPPLKLQEGSRYSIEFAVEVAASKYLDHMPLERQVRIMGREGLTVDSQTLWDQIEVLAKYLKPSHEAVRNELFRSSLLHADETWWRLMAKGGSKKWWCWSLSSERGVYHTIFDSRSRDAAEKMLEGYAGKLMVDGYGVYGSVSRAGVVTLAHCWAHVRRKFVEDEQNHPEECKAVLDLIGELYGIERTVPRPSPGSDESSRRESLALRLKVRQEKSAAVVANIRDWAYAQAALPESQFGKAIAYMLGLWEGLTRFVKDAEIPLDNNLAERALRGTVIGRKNHYGSRSKRGTEVAALFYSLVETAQVWGVEPKGYLLAAARAAIAAPGTVTLPASLLAGK